MKPSWKIVRIAGIDIHLHFTFLILLVWVAVSYYLRQGSWKDALGGLVLTLSLFTIVVLHELGHALTARHFGIQTRDITLLPIGGVARLERLPEKPQQELLVALAGPAVNVVLAAIFLVAFVVSAELSAAWRFQLLEGNVLTTLLWVNVSLAVFNLLPAFPMDGGRVLRSLLAMQMNYVRATDIAARIGRGVAVVFGLIGVFTNPFLVFIALFVWVGAVKEAEFVRMKSALAGVSVSQIMMKTFQTLAPADTLAGAARRILDSCQQDFPVVEEGRVVGVLSHSNLLESLAERGPFAKVADRMQSDFCASDPTELIEAVLARMADRDTRLSPVIQDGRLAGILTTQNVGDYLMIQTALSRTSHSRHGQQPRAMSPHRIWA